MDVLAFVRDLAFDALPPTSWRRRSAASSI
jgi:hypothetical protein